MTLIRYPQNVFNSIQELDRFFDEAFTAFSRGNGTAAGVQRPAADWLEEDKNYLVHLELPGVPKEAVNISVQDGVLTVEAKQEAKEENRQRRFHYRRSFHLPDTVDAEAVTAKLEHGVLQLTLPKAEKAQPRQIAVE
ncbi:MAG: Hsp20/alpha crystallin family protein [Verrucomicrobiota bacterium JB022]|nr:Hsp20/alpha crystallin family protein [Verrucomicrobiota bacterium JB022]